jgi:hypothetical protein
MKILLERGQDLARRVVKCAKGEVALCSRRRHAENPNNPRPRLRLSKKWSAMID